MRKKLPLFSLVTAVVLIGAMFAFGSTSFAGSSGPADDQGDPGPLNTTLWKTFSTAKDGGTTISVSTHGNVYSFNSPTGSEHINVGQVGEGYVLCYNAVNAYDIGLAETGFAASTTGSNNVLRNTSDGVLSLNQVFTFSAANRSIQVAMTVKNLTGATVNGVVLRRIVDADVDGDFSDDWHTATADSYTAWEIHSLVLKHISQASGVSHTAKVTTTLFTDVEGCAPTPVAGPVLGDYAGSVDYSIGNLAAGKSKTVKVTYERN
jgi:hypothetical protein